MKSLFMQMLNIAQLLFGLILFVLIGDTSTYQSTVTTMITVSAVIVCLVALIKWYCAGGVCRSKARLDGKIKL